jgi:hypothetical protein
MGLFFLVGNDLRTHQVVIVRRIAFPEDHISTNLCPLWVDLKETTHKRN